jgi:phosphatidylglycerophosphate synthase
VLAVGAHRLVLTPNQVTVISALFTASGIALLASRPPTAALSLSVAGLLLVGYALDSADGQLSRLTGLSRSSGEWLDHTVDMAKTCTLQAAVLVSWWQWPPAERELTTGLVLLPLAFLTVNVLAFFGWLLSDLLIRAIRARNGASQSPPKGPATITRSLLRTPSDYGVMVLLFALWATPLFVPLYAVLLVLNALILALALPTWFRQVRRAEEEPS